MVGKPAEFMLGNIADAFELERNQICMVGDRLDTDILFGQNGGLSTCLVLSGEHLCILNLQRHILGVNSIMMLLLCLLTRNFLSRTHPLVQIEIRLYWNCQWHILTTNCCLCNHRGNNRGDFVKLREQDTS